MSERGSGIRIDWEESKNIEGRKGRAGEREKEKEIMGERKVEREEEA